VVKDSSQGVGWMRVGQRRGADRVAAVFSGMLRGAAAPRSPQSWEGPRLYCDINALERGKTRNSISYVTSEIMVAAFEYARAAGVEDAVAVIDPVMNRVLKRSANAPYDYLGAPTPMGKVTAMAALMDCSPERIKKVREFAGIEGNVIMPEDMAFTRFGDCEIDQTGETPSRSSIPLNALRQYCAEQLAAAKNPEDMRAALRLLAAIDPENTRNKETTAAGAITHETT